MSEKLLPKGHNLLPYATPLHVSELIFTILKQTFADLEEGNPYKYDPDYEKSCIGFDVTLNKESDIYGKKPLIILSRGAQTTGSTVLGDMATHNMLMDSYMKSSMVHSSVDIKVVSRRKAEVENISQFIFTVCMMYRTVLPKLTGGHMFDSLSLSPVSMFDQDDKMFITNLSYNYQMQYRWSQEIDGILLRSVSAIIN